MSPTKKNLYAHGSRRSVVHSTKGIVSSVQPSASQAGIKILEKGGNAADAAVAVAAALNVTEPCSTGIGGDMFCLYYNASTKRVHSLNGSGRSPSSLTLPALRKELGLKDGEVVEVPIESIHAVTVPGAAGGWVDVVERFGSGKVSLQDVLTPAISLAENGYGVAEIVAHSWSRSEKLIRKASPNWREILKKDDSAPDGYRAPRHGEFFNNPNLAATFRKLGAEGKKGFYEGEIAQAIVDVVKARGGHLSLEDLKHHAETGSEDNEPIKLRLDRFGVNPEKSGLDVWEHPPNGQGIVALIALGILQQLENAGTLSRWKPEQHNSLEYLHALIESLRIAFSDAHWFVTDPKVVKVPVSGLLDSEYLAERAKLFSSDRAIHDSQLRHGSPAFSSSDTVYFCATDSQGNACSFINSNYTGFGSNIVPAGTGFTLQNRGANFTISDPAVEPIHPNAYAPRKRPYHTIIPAMATNVSDGSLAHAFGVMGGFMQPQGHVQTLLNMHMFGMDEQSALDAPRFCIGEGTPDMKPDRPEHSEGIAPEGEDAGGANAAADDDQVLGGVQMVYLEEGISPDVVEGLRKLGHRVELLSSYERAMFGRGQIISSRIDKDGKRVYSAGSDPRGDGQAIPFY